MGSVVPSWRAALDVASGDTSLVVEVVGLASSMPSIGVAVGDGVFWSSNGDGVVSAFTCSPFLGGRDEEGTALLLCSVLVVDNLRGFGAKRLSR
jgi:hypothetical protein